MSFWRGVLLVYVLMFTFAAVEALWDTRIHPGTGYLEAYLWSVSPFLLVSLVILGPAFITRYQIWSRERRNRT